MPLEDIFLALSNENIKPFDAIFINIHRRIISGGESFKDIFLSEFYTAQTVLGFGEEEMNLIKNTAELLGNSNVEGQEKYIKGLINISEKILKSREDEFKKIASSYKKLGIMAGLFLVIVFI
jgi:stage III sporulation protein AB